MIRKYFCKFEQCVLDEKKHSQKLECLRSMAYILVRKISPNKTFLSPSFVEVGKTMWAQNSINFLSTFANSFDCWKGSKTKSQQFRHPHVMSYLIQYFNNVWCSSVNNQSKFLECCRNFSRLFIFNKLWMSRKAWSINVKRLFHLISLVKSLIDKSLVLNEPLNNEDH